ncbi:MAG TPA: hypothetical protein VF255_08305 [Solirubrobacterales bacterium]
MKVKVVMLVVAGLLLMTGTADAFKWRMSYGQAKSESKAFAQGVCRELPDCTRWAVGPCLRRSLSRFDCTIGIFGRGAEPGEEIQCDQVLHWGVDRSGAVVLKNFSRPHCHLA